MDLANPVTGADLNAQHFIVDGTARQISLNLGPAFSVDPNTGQIVVTTAAGTTAALASLGFDEQAKTLTAILADGTHVVCGLPTVVTTSDLAARTTPILSVFDQPIGNYRAFTG
jgi:hypothetical protein